MNQTPIKTNGGLGELHPSEIDLIRNIRDVYRYGTIQIVTVDGLPDQILKTIVRKKLKKT